MAAKTTEAIGTDVQKAKDTLKIADAVMLDVDGTLVQELPLHELARFCGNEKSVIDLATRALSTDRPFREALAECMDIMTPTKAVVTEFNSTKAINFSYRGKELVEALKAKGIPIYLVSGSFETFIKPIASEINIDKSNIYANKLEFYYNGDYAGLSQNAMMLQTFGKTAVANLLKKKYGYKHLVNIGDGLTDLSAQEATDAFIGYGGNIVRCEVKEGAMWYTTDFTDIIKVLNGCNK